MPQKAPEQWDIWDAQWYLAEDRTKPEKVRPILVLATGKDGKKYTCCKITSSGLGNLKGTFFIPTRHRHFKLTGLDNGSTVVLLDRFDLAPSDFKSYRGFLSEDFEASVLRILREASTS